MLAVKERARPARRRLLAGHLDEPNPGVLLAGVGVTTGKEAGTTIDGASLRGIEGDRSLLATLGTLN